jgi:hypothetical protein
VPGKRAFLRILINKELMQLKADELGYDEDAKVVAAKAQLTDYHAANIFFEDAIQSPADQVSHEEFDHYYSRLGEKRICQYLITNFRDDAEKARQALLEGGKWEDVVAEYHDGATPPSGVHEIPVPWGQYEDTFEREVFNTPVGEVTQPIQTSYGFWVMRPVKVEQGKKPPVDKIRTRVLDSIRQRKMNLAKRDLNRQVRESRNFKLDEGSLYLVYQGLPPDEQIFQSGTQQPTPREELAPLALDPEDYDRLLVSYESNDGVVEITLGDYKATFDKMNVFQRPKRSDMLGGVRNRLLSDLDKQIMTQEAVRRGYRDDPRVQKLVMNQVYEMMVTKLHADVVEVDEDVTEAQVREFWAEHAEDYFLPEGRHGRMVVCADARQAELATKELRSGHPFAKVLEKYGTNPKNKRQGGVFEPIRLNSQSAFRRALFDTPVGEITEPVPLQQGFIIAVVDSVAPPYQPTLEEKYQEIAKRIVLQRKDDYLNSLLDTWRQEYGVTIHEEALAAVDSWEELTAPQPVENRVL